MLKKKKNYINIWYAKIQLQKRTTFKLSCNPQSRVLPSGLKVKQRTPLVCRKKELTNFHLHQYGRYFCNSNDTIRHKITSGPAEPISSKVSRSQNLTVLSAEPEKWKYPDINNEKIQTMAAILINRIELRLRNCTETTKNDSRTTILVLQYSGRREN